MSFLSIEFYGFLLICIFLYYIFPLKNRWFVLLAGSIGFYSLISVKALAILIVLCFFSFILGIIIEKKRKKILLTVVIILLLVPMICSRVLLEVWIPENVLIITGLSYFTLQMISYIVDIYKGRVYPQKSFWKYFLFISFFPHIVQGPIPRYEELQFQLIEGHKFEEEKFIKGFMLILWGFFLKMMLADKVAVVVNAIFNNYEIYEGMYIIVGGVLYSIQIYTDFLAYTTIAQGVAALFGISLADNFAHPYLSCSMKEFWERWHISLSRWLKDYIYIPLGGKKRRSINIVVTFLASGLWHGFYLKYFVWGILHAVYRIVGKKTFVWREQIYASFQVSAYSNLKRTLKQAGTFVWVMIAWIIFRADTLEQGLKMLYSSLSVFNPQILWDGSILKLGLDWQEFFIMISSVLVLIRCSIIQEKYSIRDRILKQPFAVRCGIYVFVISVIWVFGTYGYEFEASDFIYGGF